MFVIIDMLMISL